MQTAAAADVSRCWNSEHLRAFRKMALGVLLVGLAWRTLRYFMHLPIWGDEAMLALNFLHSDYFGLTQGLENCQIAPILFLWGELTACRWFGPTVLSLRLLPFLTSLGSLVLFYQLARQMVGSLASGLALGFLAVAVWPVTMGSFIKPYAFDLFLSLALLLAAVAWLRKPDEGWRLALLIVLAPVALLGSFPAAFIAGGISLALTVPIYKHGTRAVWCYFVTYNVVVALSFAAAWWIGKHQLSTGEGDANTGIAMQRYWANGFPPSSPGAFLLWFVRANTGQMTAYPIGAEAGGSSLTVALCLVGAWQWAKSKNWSWLVLFGAPFGFGLLAAAMHRYPYGTSGRLSQHVAPIVCLLAGLGAATLIELPRWNLATRWKWAVAAFGLLATVGMGGVIREIFWPNNRPSASWTQSVMVEVRARASNSGPVLLCNEPQMSDLFRWNWALRGNYVSWNGDPLAWFGSQTSTPCQFWAFCYGNDASLVFESLKVSLVTQDPTWKLVESVPFDLPPVFLIDDREHCELYHFVRERNTAQTQQQEFREVP
jgi:hypothetical protein